MKLRKLKYKDIPLMLEWMHDDEITKYLAKDFSKYDYESQKKFIDSSKNEKNYTFAIVSDDDEYLGSISLKNVDNNCKSAEYAICLRKKCIGKSIAKEATDLILKYAFEKLNLNRIYLNVLSENVRANKFYQKYGFIYEGETKESINIRGSLKDLKWYRFLKSDFIKKMNTIKNVKKVNFQVMGDGRGNLIPIEYPKQLEFPLKRIYYIFDVGENVKRGFHSHNDLEQVLIAVNGSVKVLVKTPYEEKIYELNNPSEGLYIGPMIWREMFDFSSGAVLLVLASHEYDEKDYIRDYDEYQVKAKKYFKEMK